MGVESGRMAIGNRAWDAVLREVDEQRTRLRKLEDEMREVTAQATSTDRLVTVVINARGLLTDLHIDPLAMRRHRAGQLAELIADLVRRADDTLTERRNQIAAEIVLRHGPDYSDVQ
jgi:DNA-binding protein YbaB